MTITITSQSAISGQSRSWEDTYIIATGNDTTTPVYGPVIDNSNGDLVYTSAYASVTNKTGTSPTLKVALYGCNTATGTFNALLNESGSAIESSATSISSAVTISCDTVEKLRRNFPKYVKWGYVLGGTSPGATATVSVTATYRTNNTAIR